MRDDDKKTTNKGIIPHLPRNRKSDQQRNQLNKTQPNGFGTVRFVQTTTVGQCNLNEYDQTNEAKKTTHDGNTNVFPQRRATVATTGKTVVAVVKCTLAAQHRGIDVRGVASCGAVAGGVAVGQINVVVFVQVKLAHQCGIGAAQTSRGESTTFKSGIVVVASGPPKFGLDTVPIDVAIAGSTKGAFDACPICWVGGGVVEVLKFVAVGRFFKAQVLARSFSSHGVVVPRWTRFARGTWVCVLVLKGSCWTILTDRAECTTKLSFVARLTSCSTCCTRFSC